MDSAGSDGVLVSSEASDSDDIRWALETAGAMWNKADYPEALRWLRRAAEMAAEEGADLRAVELAKVAAELRSRIDVPATEFPASAPATPPRDSSVGGSSDEVFERAAERLLNSDPPPAMTWSSIIAIEGPPAVEPEPQSSPGSAPERIEKPAAKPPPLDRVQARVTPVPSRSSVTPIPSRSSVTPIPSRSSVTPQQRELAPVRAHTPSSPLAAAPTNGSKPHAAPLPTATSTTKPSMPAPKELVSHQAIRVAVTTSADQPGVLIARALAAGERPPAGAKEALFIALEPGVDLSGR
jgi:hypothetical protein